MVDFNDSLRRGLDAAKKAKANRDEIQGVFAQLNQALYQMSDGKVEIAIVPRGSTLDALARLVVILDAGKQEQVLAVRPIAHKGIQAKQIARWKEGEAGYPCSVIWGERHASCDDVDSLSSELAELVSSPRVGEAIVSAMQAQPPDPKS